MKATERFSGRVENYIHYRPDYPHEVIGLLRSRCQLEAASIIADIGSGTGILAEIFLRNGNRVYGVEPNREMREAGERLLRRYAGFHSVAATAQATALADGSVDFVTAGQAFHWFDRDKAKVEFRRILKPHGWIVLIWNERLEESTAFSRAYERLLRTHATDYKTVNHKRIDEDTLRSFFEGDFGLNTFRNSQRLDLEGLKGRLLSSSYVPEAGHPRYAAVIAEAGTIFDTHQVNGTVTLEYDTRVYYGRLN